MGRVLLTHLASVAVMLAVMKATGESPRIFVYGLFINYLYRLLTLYGLARLREAGGTRGRDLARLLTRPPHPQRPSYQVTVETSSSISPGGLGAYLVVTVVLAGFTFILVNVANQEIATPGPVLADELKWGFAAAGVWWLFDLVDRRITIRFGESLPTNLGYNSAETTVLALTVLTGGVISGFSGSPWPYFLTLVFFKTLYEVWDEAKFPRGEHPPATA
ncbi:MAG: hypothetical protein HYX46_05660 [Betaproteobacteria bacterium]|nr:hypothetical protein [Betaproteobacteria bacterium]